MITDNISTEKLMKKTETFHLLLWLRKSWPCLLQDNVAGNCQNCSWSFWEKLIMDYLSNGNGTEKVCPSLASQSWIWKLPRTVNSVHVGGKYLFHQSHPWMPFICIQPKGKKKHLAPWIKGHKTQREASSPFQHRQVPFIKMGWKSATGSKSNNLSEP